MVCERVYEVFVKGANTVLILVLMEYGLRAELNIFNHRKLSVLILVLMEYGLRGIYNCLMV